MLTCKISYPLLHVFVRKMYVYQPSEFLHSPISVSSPKIEYWSGFNHNKSIPISPTLFLSSKQKWSVLVTQTTDLSLINKFTPGEHHQVSLTFQNRPSKCQLQSMMKMHKATLEHKQSSITKQGTLSTVWTVNKGFIKD